MLTEKDSIAVDLCRFVSMALIISCHVLQAYANDWAFVCNVGVQVFFLLSGFLYGAKDELLWKPFYIGRIRKVYLPYLVLILVSSPILHWGLGVQVGVKQLFFYLVNLQAFTTPIEGLNHLWFLSILMIGYLLTPAVRWLWHKKWWAVIVSLLLICVLEYCFVQKMYSNFTWVLTYVIGVLIGLSREHIRTVMSAVMVFISFVLLCVGIWVFPNVSAFTATQYSHLSIWFHVACAVLLFYVVRLLSRWNWWKCLKSSFQKINGFSYEVYLTHHVFCLGAASLLFITPCWELNITMMLVAAILSACLLKLIMNGIYKLI